MQNLTIGQAATIGVRGAWHYGLTGTITEIDAEREIAVVRFDGHGSLRVPITLVLPA